jgi:hypothetical protein
MLGHNPFDEVTHLGLVGSAASATYQAFDARKTSHDLHYKMYMSSENGYTVMWPKSTPPPNIVSDRRLRFNPDPPFMRPLHSEVLAKFNGACYFQENLNYFVIATSGYQDTAPTTWSPITFDKVPVIKSGIVVDTIDLSDGSYYVELSEVQAFGTGPDEWNPGDNPFSWFEEKKATDTDFQDYTARPLKVLGLVNTVTMSSCRPVSGVAGAGYTITTLTTNSIFPDLTAYDNVYCSAVITIRPFASIENDPPVPLFEPEEELFVKTHATRVFGAASSSQPPDPPTKPAKHPVCEPARIFSHANQILSSMPKSHNRQL